MSDDEALRAAKHLIDRRQEQMREQAREAAARHKARTRAPDDPDKTPLAPLPAVPSVKPFWVNGKEMTSAELNAEEARIRESLRPFGLPDDMPIYSRNPFDHLSDRVEYNMRLLQQRAAPAAARQQPCPRKKRC